MVFVLYNTNGSFNMEREIWEIYLSLLVYSSGKRRMQG